MPLRSCLPSFNDSIVRIESGKRILNDYIRPLLQNSTSYYKISSFFSPSVVKAIFQELNTCFQNKGSIRFIIGIHDSAKLIPALDEIQTGSKSERFKKAVQKIISDGIKECLELLQIPEYFINVFAELIKQD